MAVRFDANGEALTRTTSLPPIGTFSCLGWFYGLSFSTTWSTFFALGTTAADPIYQAATDSVAVFALWNGSSSVKGSTASINTWYHIALVVEGTGAGQVKLYVNGVVDVTHAGNASVPAQKLWVGESPFTEPLDGRAAAIKIYDVALTADEVKQEMHTIRPVRTADLNAWYPVFPGSGERVRDYSGNGRDWTEAGTVTDEDPPPVGWGAPGLVFPFTAAGGVAITTVSSEYGFEALSNDVTQAHNLAALSSEYGFEGSVARFLKNIAALGSEYGVEVGSSQLIKNLVIASLESGYELGSSQFSTHLIAAASEYGIDIQSVAITVPASGATVEVLVSHSEYGWEAESTLIRFFKRGGTHALRTAAVAVDSRKSIVVPDVRRRTPGGLN